MHFNPEQESAVCHKDGPMMVLSGPGSGKTAVITGRTIELIKNGISPESILVVTFTRAAALEMKERFLKQMQQSRTSVTFGTFHGVFYGILRYTYHLTGDNILSEDVRYQLLRELMREHYTGTEQEAELSAMVGREISAVKSAALSLAHFYSKVLPEETFRDVYNSYETWKKQNRKLDFDDLMQYTLHLFENHADILEKWQKKFRYILVDEFQDISPVQYRVIKLLALPENNLFIVGDDDQSIYRFRGASPEIMLGFPQDFPDCSSVTLSENYRSTGEIVEKASELIVHNKRRYPKQLHAVSGSGAPVHFHYFDRGFQENEFLTETIEKNISEGIAPEEIAVLSRTNNGCRAIVESFMSVGIPFILGDTLPCIYDHWISRTISAYLRLSNGQRDREDFLKIYNKPNRYISRAAFSDHQVSFEMLYQFYEDKDWMCERIETLETDLKIMGRLSPYGAVMYLRNSVGFDQYLKEYAALHGRNEEELLSVVDEYCEAARNYKNWEIFEQHIQEYREELKQKKDHTTHGVIVSTLHGSKGMEYHTVFIPDVNEGMIPYRKSVLPEEIEEERRLLYVGMTRAKRELYLLWAGERFEKKLEPSRFLEEFGRELL